MNKARTNQHSYTALDKHRTRKRKRELKSERLEKNYRYDFDSEFWTDEQRTMMQEIIEATEE